MLLLQVSNQRNSDSLLMKYLSFQNVSKLCANVDLSEKRPRIDLSDLEYIEPFALIYLCMFLRYHNQQGRLFEIYDPKNCRMQEYFQEHDFYGKIDAPFAQAKWFIDTSTLLRRIVNISKKPDLADCMAEEVRQKLIIESVNVDIEEISILIGEVIDNFVQHS